VVTVSDQLAAGYAAPVTLTATATGGGTLAYAWTQTGGPTAVLTGADTATMSFTTQDFAAAMGPAAIANARFDTLGINPDQALGYLFQLVVTDSAGLATTTTVTVNATPPTTGLRMVPIGVPVWLQGNGPIFPLPPVAPATTGLPQTTWSWTLDTSAAAGSTAVLAFATSQFPSFVPDVTGTYTLTETVANQTLPIYAGTWQGEMTAAAQTVCLMCHGSGTDIAPNIFPPWEGTAHYSALQRKIDGEDGPGFTAECLSCHTVGYDKLASAKNNGFDDVEATSGWTFPATLEASNWTTLLDTPNLGQLAGIQCENCHGPQAGGTTGPHANISNLDIGARISFSAAVCATCHQEGPLYYKPAQWEGSPHADLALAVSEGSVEESPVPEHCGRCHTAQGYAQYAGGLVEGYYAYLTSDGKPLDTSPTPTNTVATVAQMAALGMGKATVEPQTCTACHDPHAATNPSQLRIYDAVLALPNGMTNVSGMGAGVVCLTCHNSRDGEHTDFATQTGNASGIMGPGALTSFSGPHAAGQGDVMFGFNAYFNGRYNPSPHLAVTDTCAGCHSRVTTASEQAANQTSSHSFVVDSTICAACHSANVDGVALQASYQAELDALRTLFAGKTITTINAALAAGNLVARAYDPATQLYSSTSASNVIIPTASGPVTEVDYAPIGTVVYGGPAVVGITLDLAAPVMVQLVNADGTSSGVPQAITNLTVTLSSLKLPAPPSGPQQTPFNAATADAENVLVLYKSYWNMDLLNNDNTFGIHNPGFYDSVLANTTGELEVLP
jgi:predicted CXXCH cytochrome family protein